MKRVEIDLPSVIVQQRIRNEFDVAEIGKKFEQRIAWFGDKNLVARITEQTENVGISFAGAGRQNQAVRIEMIHSMFFAIVMADSLTRGEQTSRLRVVMHCFRICQRTEHGFSVRAHSGLGGIRHGEI